MSVVNFFVKVYMNMDLMLIHTAYVCVCDYSARQYGGCGGGCGGSGSGGRY